MSVEYTGSPLSRCGEEEFALKPHNNLFQAFRAQNQAKLKFWVGLQSHLNFSQFFHSVTTMAAFTIALYFTDQTLGTGYHTKAPRP